MSVFVTSDTHFGHEKILTFRRPDGEPLRPFSSIEHMHDAIVERWNGTVRPNDVVYHLGDVAISVQSLRILDRLNGKKILVMGNRDRFSYLEYSWYFSEMKGVVYYDNLIFSHIPVHESSFEGHFDGNVHGHLHCHLINNFRYFNACVEVNNFSPVALEDIKAYFKANERAPHVQHSHQGAMERSHS